MAAEITTEPFLTDRMKVNIRHLADLCHCDVQTALSNALETRVRELEESREELYRLLDEGREAVLAGKTRPAEEVFEELRQGIKNGSP